MTNMQYCIQTYNSKYNVYKSDFKNAYFGIKTELPV